MSAEHNGRPHNNPDECPDGWRDVRLSSVADIRFSNVDKKSESGEKPVRLCNYTDVYNDDYVTADMDFMQATATLTEVARFGIDVGDVIITKDSETPDDIGVPAVVDSIAPNLVCGYHLALLRPNQDELDPTFLAKQLSCPRIVRYFGQQANGTTRYGLSSAAIAGTRLYLPEPSQQQVVSRLVRLVDVAIERTEEVIAKLKQVRAGLLHDLLTHGLDDNGELRDPLKHSEQFHDSPLGQIPTEWKLSTVEVEFPLQRGFDITVATQKHGTVPVVSSSGVSSWHDTAMVNGPGVVTGRKGKLGGVYYIDGPFWPHDTSLWVTDFNGNSERFGAMVLSHLRLERFDAATSVPTLNRNTVHPLAIALPQRSEQDRIVSLIESFDTRLEVERVVSEKLLSLKTGLMFDLLTGRVMVPETIATGAAP